MIACSRCGRESDDDARFCAACGAPLTRPATAAREERKVVTVVFADIVGSTARAETLDPEDVRAILAPYHERLRHELERFGGTVEKFIGDAVVAVFGAPVSHEDDPERGVRASLAILDAIAELNDADPALGLQVRIGVNTGEALVDLGARPESGEGMVSGDVINTAARLQSAAPPDGILVGEPTYRATERPIEYVEHPAIEAKGKAVPVPAWRAVATRARVELEDAALGRATLVGRTRELALLADALERVRRDERPQLVTLVGVPGIGKSRLVHELSQIVERDPELIVWRRGRSLPYGEGVTYWALGEIVKAQAGILESDGAEETSSKLSRAVADLLDDPAEAAWVERNLGALVGVSGGDTTPAHGQASAARRRFLEALAERGPAVLVFEDLHWADDDLLDFVDELADRLDAVPLLLVCTARPELLSRRPGWGGGKLNSATVSLAPLTADETARLLHELLRQSVLPADTQRAIVARAAGVPLFAEEYARMLGSGASENELPETLHGIVAARIDALSAADKALLQDAAVLGKVFWSDALGTLSETEPEPLEDMLRTLERREFVRRERRSAVEGARQFVFLHALVRDVAYGQIPRAARSAKHRATAEWISALPADRAEERAEMLAHHLEAAISYGASAGIAVDDLRPRAVAAVRDAGDRAWALNIVSRSQRLYARALELAGDSAPDPELLFLHGRSQMWAEGVGGDPSHDLGRAIDGLAAVGKNELAAMAAMTLERYSWNLQEPRVDLQDRALELVAGGAPTAGRAEVLANVAVRRAIGGRTAEALPLAEEAVAIARACADGAVEAQALSALAVTQLEEGLLEEAVDAIRRSLELALEAGSWDTPRSYVNAATIELEAGRVEASAALLRDGMELSRRFENTATADWLARELALSDCLTGRWDDALHGARSALTASRERGEPHYMDLVVQLVELTIVQAREGRVLERELLDTIARARAIGEGQQLCPALANGALVLARAGRLAESRELLDELAALRNIRGDSVTVAALAWLLATDDPVPVTFLGEATPWADTARMLAEGDAVGAAGLLASIGVKDYEATARLIAARGLAGTDPVEAARQLGLAAAFWREAGATALVASADEVAAALRPAAS